MSASPHNWKTHGIVQSLIDTIPDDITNVHFGAKVEANLGNELTPTQAKKQPHLRWVHEEKSNYTVLCIDPDAPSRENPEYRYWLHHLVVNVPGGNKTGDHVDLTKGRTLATYQGPAPPKDTGLHRYIYLIYQQHELLEIANLPSFDDKNRANFDLEAWLKHYKKGAELVSGNFWQSKHE